MGNCISEENTPLPTRPRSNSSIPISPWESHIPRLDRQFYDHLAIPDPESSL